MQTKLDFTTNKASEPKTKYIAEPQNIIIDDENYGDLPLIQIGRNPRPGISKRRKISSSKDIASLARIFWNHTTIDLYEEFYAVYLNRSNRVLAIAQISKGGVSGTVADPKIIYGYALTCLASSLILIHNHPSGNLNPSEADRQLTQKLKEAGKFLDTPVLDHIIVTPDFDQYFSFADEGLL